MKVVTSASGLIELYPETDTDKRAIGILCDAPDFSIRRVSNITVESGIAIRPVREHKYLHQLEHLQKLWNSHAEVIGLPRSRKITEKLKRHARARDKDGCFYDGLYEELIRNLQYLPFYMGQNDRKWCATLEWLLRQDPNDVQALLFRADRNQHENPYTHKGLNEDGF